MNPFFYPANIAEMKVRIIMRKHSEQSDITANILLFLAGKGLYEACQTSLILKRESKLHCFVF